MDRISPNVHFAAGAAAVCRLGFAFSQRRQLLCGGILAFVSGL
jgi:hypothetical protein